LRYKPPVATRIYAEDGSLIGEFFVERRYLVPLAHIPSHVRLAFLAAEDADFYRHRGVDPVGIARALVMDVMHHQVVQGGSTIAQAAVLAGLPQAPSRYDPQRRPSQAIARQHYVLERMLTENFITEEQYKAARAEPITFARRRPGTYLAAPWYVEHVRRLLEE